jgi:hypothetical protein
LSDDTIASCLTKLEEMLDIGIHSIITLVTVQYTLLTTQLCNNRLYSQQANKVEGHRGCMQLVTDLVPKGKLPDSNS